MIPTVSRQRSLVEGAAAGLVATAGMTVTLAVAHRVGFEGQPAPVVITEAGLEGAGLQDVRRRALLGAAAVAHTGYGVSMGALFGIVTARRGGPSATRGVAFAAGVLLASYQGWVPAAGVLPPLTRMPAGRRWTLIASHAVYGILLGATAARRASKAA